MTFFLPGRLLQPLLKPVIRLLLGVVAIPFFRLFVRRVVKVQEINQELEKDLGEVIDRCGLGCSGIGTFWWGLGINCGAIGTGSALGLLCRKDIDRQAH